VAMVLPDDEFWQSLDDRPPLDLGRLAPRARELALAVDHALGRLELTAMYSRNRHREVIIEGDPLGVIDAIADASEALGELARSAASQADLFARMLTTLRDIPDDEVNPPL